METEEFDELDELRLDMFGERAACQAEIGITCEECKYHDVCMGTDKEESQ